MKKNVWIINHYACDTFFDNGGRHYYFAKYLKDFGYNPTIFCSNSIHGKNDVYFKLDGLFCVKCHEKIGVDYVFIKSRPYCGNGFSRIINMYQFYRNVIKVGKKYVEKFGKPDIIYASSVHPLALVAGIKLAKHFNIECVSEIRDLWPESIVAYSTKIKPNSLICKIMYSGEKWIYKKSDKIIMTWPGGYDYIVNKKWDNEIPKNKVFHISNGVDNESFLQLSKTQFNNEILDSKDYKIFIYTGSIRKVNNLKLLVDADKILELAGFFKHRIIVYGDGDELSALKEIVKTENLTNIYFMGSIKKELVPYVLSKCYCSILHNSSTILDKYGQSQNKLFEYFAAGKPILMTYSVNYSLVRQFDCGIELSEQTPENVASAIIKLCDCNINTYSSFSNNSKEVASKYDYLELSKKLIDVIEEK